MNWTILRIVVAVLCQELQYFQGSILCKIAATLEKLYLFQLLYMVRGFVCLLVCLVFVFCQSRDQASLDRPPWTAVPLGIDMRGADHRWPTQPLLLLSNVRVQLSCLVFIQPIYLSGDHSGIHYHGSEHPGCNYDGGVLCADSGDGDVGSPKIPESREDERWRQDRSGAPWRQEYQLAGWDFHHDRYVGWCGSEDHPFIQFLLSVFWRHYFAYIYFGTNMRLY